MAAVTAAQRKMMNNMLENSKVIDSAHGGWVVTRKDKARIGRAVGLSLTTVGRTWSSLRRTLEKPATPALVRPAPRRARAQPKASAPTTTIAGMRTKSTVIIAFDVNESIGNVIARVVDAWQAARGGAG